MKVAVNVLPAASVLKCMNKAKVLRMALVALPVLLAAAAPAKAESASSAIPADSELPAIIASLDSALFDSYNRCDLTKLASFIAADVEFYHDQTGLSVGRQNLIEAVQKNICGKVHRDLVAGTLEVYPIHGYGAVEIGVHRFHQPGAPADDPGGEAKFVHLWQFKDGGWKVTRVISYEHHSLSK